MWYIALAPCIHAVSAVAHIQQAASSPEIAGIQIGNNKTLQLMAAEATLRKFDHSSDERSFS